MKVSKSKILATTLIAGFASTAALANQTGTIVGPYLQNSDEARALAIEVAQNYCVSYGGLQSAQTVGVRQNAGYFAFVITYTCNN